MPLLDGERRTLRNWLGFWLVGFIGIGLVGTILCLALWLIGQAAAAFGPPYPATTLFPLSSSLRIVPLVAAVFGVFLASVMIGNWRQKERIRREAAVRISGYHSLIGPFDHAPYFNHWWTKASLPTGAPVVLRGHGSEPSADQAAVWSQFLKRCDELLRIASDDLLQPGNPYQQCNVVDFTPCDIFLRADGGLEVEFEVTTVPEDFPADTEHEIDPVAVFSAELALRRTSWWNAPAPQ